MADLKPCPFCGREAIMRTAKHIPNGTEYTPQCSDASCAGRLTKKWLDKDVAVYAWNKRTNEDTVCGAWQSCWGDLKNRRENDEQ